MYNPPYLIKSRHSIYYFRYPVSVKPDRRVSISLQTRCPKKALRLAKALEYYTINVLAQLDLKQMEYNEIISILKDHYSEILEKMKQRIRKDGTLNEEHKRVINEELFNIDEMIEQGVDDFTELFEPEMEYKNPEHSIHYTLKEILNKKGLDWSTESEDYKKLKAAHKSIRKNYLQDILTYDKDFLNFSFLKGLQTSQDVDFTKSEYSLEHIINIYMSEEKRKATLDSTDDDKRNCLDFLTELLGKEYPINRIDGEQARYIRTCLLKTPKFRNTKKTTKNLPLLKQIDIAESNDLEILSTTTVNKYLSNYRILFKWATNLKYIKENPFEGMTVDNKKRDNRYDYFKQEQIATMLKELTKGNKGLARTDSRYWGTLLAIYTGARRNEIASLTPEDIKEDNGIWYLNITDEEETKRLKTTAAKRIVPIHSHLLELGFLEYVEQAKSFKPAKKHKGKTPRLLYDMTFHEKEKWGRNLGRFVNETFLPKLNLKTDKLVLHSLRHSFITYLSIAEVEPPTIKAIVGHEQDTVTNSIYTHYGIEHLPAFKNAIEKLPYKI